VYRIPAGLDIMKNNTERLGRLGQGLTEQVVKADTILKNINQFAHSVDVTDHSF
jgi:hypothetical protein